MINWDKITKDHGFKTEVQMWKTLLVSLRNSDAIAKYLGISRGAVQRRRHVLNLHQTDRRGQTYRKATKRQVLDNLPDHVWSMPINEIVLWIEDKHEVSISQAYVSKYRRQKGF